MAELNQTSKIWEAAIRRYEDITKKKLDDPAIKGLATVNDLRDAIESQNKAFDNFRQKRHGLYAVLSVAMAPIELVGGVASDAAATVFPASTYVFASVQYLIEAARGVSEKYDAIVEVLETLKDFTVRLETYAHHLLSPGLGGKLAEILAVILEIFAISQNEMKHGRLFSFGKSLIKATDEGKEAMQKLSKLFDSEKGIVGAETLSEVKTLAVAVDKLNIDVSKFVNSQPMHATQDQNSLQKIRAILDPSGRSDEMYHAFKRNRVPNTAVWIRDESIFKAWLGGEESAIWISGNPGAGKSYIATNVITDLMATYRRGYGDTSDISIGYFFFKDDNPSSRSFHQGLRDIAYAISQENRAYAKHILSMCDSSEDISTTYKVWQKLFMSFFVEGSTAEQSERKIFIVLDGLDESFKNERLEFLELVGDIGQSGRLRLAMFGRPEVIDDIEQYFEVPTIHVTAETNSQDISRYVRNTISKSVYLKRASKALLNEIIYELSMKAQGMFLWAKLMLTNVLKMRGEEVIRKALREAPRDLHKMIRHVLEGYSDSLRESPDVLRDVNELLAWVAVTTRPLKLGEIESLLKWKSEYGDGMIGLERSLRTQFASVFTLIRQDGLSTADLQRLHRSIAVSSTDADENVNCSSAIEDEDWYKGDDEFDSDPHTTEVTFSHASIGDFFRNENEVPISGGEGILPVGVDIKSARARAFCVCLDIMSCEPGSVKEPVSLELRSYMGSNWLEILKEIDITKTSEDDREAIASGLMSLLTKSPGLADVTANFELFNRKSLDLLKTWLEKSSSPEISAWYRRITAENDVDIINDVIQRIGKRWLATNNVDSLLDACMVVSFMSFRRGEDPSRALLSDESIVKSANWLSLEQDALWHFRLGTALRDLGHYAQALEQLQTSYSLTSDIEQWPIRHSTSWVYIEMRDYGTAVKLDIDMYQELKAIHEGQDTIGPSKWDIDLHKVCHRLVICYRELKQEDEEITYLKMATCYDRRCYVCLRRLLRLLWFRQNFDGIAESLSQMDEKLPDREYGGLIEALLTGFWTQDEDDFKYIAVAALNTGKLEWLLDAYKSAVEIARKEHKTAISVGLELTLAVIYDKGIRRREEGAEIYKRILDTYGDTRIDLMLVKSLVNTKGYLGSYLISKAVDVDPLSEAGKECGRELEDLVKRKLRLAVDDNVPSFANREHDMDLYEKNFVKSSNTFMGHCLCYLFLGNYYRIIGRTEDAMSQYTEVIKNCLAILDNDDFTDDFIAFSVLFQVIATVIAPDEAVSVFYLAWANKAMYTKLWAERNDSKTREHEGSRRDLLKQVNSLSNTVTAKNKPSYEEEDNPQAIQETLSWNVDIIGCVGCWRDFKPGEWESYYACYHCMFGFCVDCYTNLRANTYTGPVCSPLHDWYMLPAPPIELREKWQIGKIFLRGEWVDIDIWKKSLRKRFLEK